MRSAAGHGVKEVPRTVSQGSPVASQRHPTLCQIGYERGQRGDIALQVGSQQGCGSSQHALERSGESFRRKQGRISQGSVYAGGGDRAPPPLVVAIR